MIDWWDYNLGLCRTILGTPIHLQGSMQEPTYPWFSSTQRQLAQLNTMFGSFLDSNFQSQLIKSSLDQGWVDIFCFNKNTGSNKETYHIAKILCIPLFNYSISKLDFVWLWRPISVWASFSFGLPQVARLNVLVTLGDIKWSLEKHGKIRYT